jgi:hypothetical protein
VRAPSLPAIVVAALLVPLERTAAGVGVGAAEAKVKGRVLGVKCAALSGARQCVVGVFKPGRVVTAFQIKKGHVSTVVVGIVD